MDSHGRIFYIDHNNHTTTWQKPACVIINPTEDPSGTSEQTSEDSLTASHEVPQQPQSPTEVVVNTPVTRRQDDLQRQQLDQRYQRVHRAIASSSVSSESDFAGITGAGNSDGMLTYSESATFITADRQRELLIQVTETEFATSEHLLNCVHKNFFTGTNGAIHLPPGFCLPHPAV